MAVTRLGWTLTDVIVKLRRANGWKQEDLARHSGIGLATIRRIEQGDTTPSGRMLERLTATFGFRHPGALYELIPGMEPRTDAPAAPVYEAALQTVIDCWPHLLETTRESVSVLVAHDPGRSRVGSAPNGVAPSVTPAPVPHRLPSHPVHHRARRQRR